ncbi:MAG: hypothetical protein OEZ23_06005, partial [Gammaproteobacteria bacterium]|nr:hypothetical protein [Gammaproteobacteria bacterium]
KLRKDEARIQWTRSADQLALDIRAYNPEPMAWTLLSDLRVRLIAADSVADYPFTQQDGKSPPGTVLALGKDGILVKCGQGVLRITRLQLPLGKGTPQHARDILNARAGLFAVGKQFE